MQKELLHDEERIADSREQNCCDRKRELVSRRKVNCCEMKRERLGNLERTALRRSVNCCKMKKERLEEEK